MRLLGKIGVVAGAVMLVGMASPGEAATILVANFCPQNASCPAGLTEASLTISDIAGGDANDYNVTATFTGNASAPAFLDMFSFTIAGADTPGGYTNVTLQS